MSFDWLTYLKIAEQLKTWSLDPRLDEAKYRSSISRAYYSVHNLTKSALVFKKGVDFDSEDIKSYIDKWGSHWILIKLLQTSDSPIVRNLGSELEELKEMREDADYRIADYKRIKSNFASMASSATGKADGVIKDLQIFDDISINLNPDRLSKIQG